MIYKNVFAPAGHALPKFEDGDIVEGGNFSRPYADKLELIDGGKKVLFKDCNLVNCKTTLPAPGCNTYCGPLPVDTPPTEQEKDEALKAEVRRLTVETYGAESAKVLSIEQAIDAVFKPVDIEPIKGPLGGDIINEELP